MFQGIIEHTATVIEHTASSLTLKMPKTWKLKAGSSVAVNGTCLTVVKTKPGIAYFDLNRETVSLTNLGDLQTGEAVNLELPMRLGDAISGHLVLGHVDSKAEVAGIRKNAGSTDLQLRMDGPQAASIVPKGSVAIDGVSLTINDIRKEGRRTAFDVCLIPETLKRTNLSSKKLGDKVNIETDYLVRAMLYQKNHERKNNG